MQLDTNTNLPYFRWTNKPFLMPKYTRWKWMSWNTMNSQLCVTSNVTMPVCQLSRCTCQVLVLEDLASNDGFYRYHWIFSKYHVDILVHLAMACARGHLFLSQTRSMHMLYLHMDQGRLGQAIHRRALTPVSLAHNNATFQQWVSDAAMMKFYMTFGLTVIYSKNVYMYYYWTTQHACGYTVQTGC